VKGAVSVRMKEHVTMIDAGMIWMAVAELFVAREVDKTIERQLTEL